MALKTSIKVEFPQNLGLTVKNEHDILLQAARKAETFVRSRILAGKDANDAPLHKPKDGGAPMHRTGGLLRSITHQVRSTAKGNRRRLASDLIKTGRQDLKLVGEVLAKGPLPIRHARVQSAKEAAKQARKIAPYKGQLKVVHPYAKRRLNEQGKRRGGTAMTYGNVAAILAEDEDANYRKPSGRPPMIVFALNDREQKSIRDLIALLIQVELTKK